MTRMTPNGPRIAAAPWFGRDLCSLAFNVGDKSDSNGVEGEELGFPTRVTSCRYALFSGVGRQITSPSDL